MASFQLAKKAKLAHRQYPSLDPEANTQHTLTRMKKFDTTTTTTTTSWNALSTHVWGMYEFSRDSSVSLSNGPSNLGAWCYVSRWKLQRKCYASPSKNCTTYIKWTSHTVRGITYSLASNRSYISWCYARAHLWPTLIHITKHTTLILQYKNHNKAV